MNPCKSNILEIKVIFPIAYVARTFENKNHIKIKITRH